MYTIFGSTGFIGKHLVDRIKSLSIDCNTPGRDFVPNKGQNLGEVIYAIGLTSDFRNKPFETIDAHVMALSKILRNCTFDSFLYLSSTRVYNGANSSNEEINLIVNPNNPSDLYNLSKLMGESLCLSVPNKSVKVARISNVVGDDFGSGNFLFSVIQAAVKMKKVELRQSLESSKDYIYINDVVENLLNIGIGESRIYNIASGNRISNQQILDLITKYVEFKLNVIPSTEQLTFPAISIEKIKREFNFQPTDVLEKMDLIIQKYINEQNDTNRH